MAYTFRGRLAAIGLAIISGVGVKFAFDAPVAAAVAAAMVFTSSFLRGDVRPDPRLDAARRSRISSFASEFSDSPNR